MTTIAPEETTSISDIDGEERDRMSHYAKKEDILKAQIEGVPCRALCGKLWIPARDPEKYPVCPTCKDIFEQLEKD